MSVEDISSDFCNDDSTGTSETVDTMPIDTTTNDTEIVEAVLEDPLSVEDAAEVITDEDNTTTLAENTTTDLKEAVPLNTVSSDSTIGTDETTAN